VRSLFAPRFLSRLRVTGLKYEGVRVEQVLALSRLFVALMGLAAWLIHLGGSSPHYRIGLFLLLGYVIASVILFARLQLGGELGTSFALSAQVNDVGWPALLCLFAEVPNSTFFLLFLFAMIAASFRWGFAETMATALVSAALLLFQAIAVAHGPLFLRNLLFTPAEPARLLMRCVFLLMAGSLLGFLAETEKQLRAEIAFTNHLLSLARVGSRFSAVLQNVLCEFGRIFQGQAVYEVTAQSSTGRAFRWELLSLAQPAIHLREIAPADKSCELMPDYPYTFFMRRNSSNESCAITALDEDGGRLKVVETKGLEMPVPHADSVLVVSHEMGHDWYGRLVLLNARLGRQREHELRFAQNVMRQLAPALYSVYLFRGFRSRAGATERARVARELHDTTIQSLISIEMQVDVLRRHSSDSQLTGELGRIQELLRHEVLNLRELMQTLRPIDIGPHQLLDFVAELVERFSRDTGIAVRFISELEEVTLPATTCRELARVVQEGLANIRKHSSARSAIVRFGVQDGLWKLVINDDGDGFPFAGRFTLRDLDGLRRGPAIIKERVRAVGGDMVIESTPGHGTRLEITIPQKGYESYG
jgi:signal transduction histidine kinase